MVVVVPGVRPMTVTVGVMRVIFTLWFAPGSIVVPGFVESPGTQQVFGP